MNWRALGKVWNIDEQTAFFGLYNKIKGKITKDFFDVFKLLTILKKLVLSRNISIKCNKKGNHKGLPYRHQNEPSHFVPCFIFQLVYSNGFVLFLRQLLSL